MLIFNFHAYEQVAMNIWRFKALCLSLFLLTSASFEPAAAQQEAPHRPQAAAHAFQNVSQAGGGPIKIIYVVPDDRRERQDFNSAIADAARDFQTWLGAQLDGKSIALASPAVTVFHSQRNAAWFKGDASPPSYFWRITTKELTGLGLVKYNDPNMRYLIFVDADLRCGQSGAGGDGIAVLEANNLRGLVGDPIVPACLERTGADLQRRSRWIGGIGHELLHTLGLGHADQYEDCRDTACHNRALMKFGYVSYPNADLRPQDKAFLLTSKSIFRN